LWRGKSLATPQVFKELKTMTTVEELRGIQETLYLKSIPGVWDSIVEGMKAPLSDFVDADSVKWEV